MKIAKRNARALVIAMGMPLMLCAQGIWDPKEGMAGKRPYDTRVVPYPHVSEADVMWSKRLWRYIDLKEKMNLPLAYPKSSQPLEERRNLFDIIHDAVLEGTVTAYEAYDGLQSTDEFTHPISLDRVDELGMEKPDTVLIIDPVTGKEYEQVIPHPFDRDRVVMFKLKEDWFFDKKRSVMECRIVGIAPVIEVYSESGEFMGLRDFYWVYFPEIRPVLAQYPVMLRQTHVFNLNFDDLFAKRMFSSVVVKESNVYDRYIKEYKTGMDALLEAQDIKSDVMNFEQDLWEY
ncbi:MAG: gliding motility protein GldN [Flavobacteriales bacterium]|nr:gliding motility protein GldN [Flavobacteriales bacterium]MCB9449188.1 gliding motility protein GldN [Flavobacteriales bacterium]